MHAAKLIFIPLALCLSCASKVADRQPEFAPLEATTLSPVSDYGQNRIYSDSATNAAPDDLKLGSQIRELFFSDNKLAVPPSKVTASAHQGVVTLQGTVASAKDKQRIEERVEQVPGVVRVDDELKVRWY